MLLSVYNWLDKRLHITELFASTAGHHVPANSGSWWYAFGSSTLLCFILQIVTGTLLAFVYVPSTNEAWNSLQYLNHVQFLGWYLRALHNWGSNFMVALMTLHLVQVFLFGAFKYPRELTWITGVFLMIGTMALAFTGQVMRFDQDAYWGLGIGASITARVPFIGDRLVHLLLGGPIIAGETLSRFFTLHVFILPGTILGIVAMHLRLVLTRGINEYPEPGRLVEKSTYNAYYEELIDKTGVPFVPDAIGKDLIFAAGTIVALLVVSAVLGPAGPAGVPDPTLVNTNPRPDFYFLSVFAMFALLPDWTEAIVLFVMPAVVLGFLIILPFIAGTGEKSYRRRPIAVLSVILIGAVLGALSYLGETSPWSPKMDAWTAAGIPPTLLKGRTPVEMRGAAVLQNKQCRNCHSLGGVGGKRGPELDAVATRLTRDELVRQVIQGGGNMPAYGKNLNPGEVDAIVSYLTTLKPSYEPASRDSRTPSTPENKGGTGRTRGNVSGG